MPILFPSFKQDIAGITRIADGVAKYWNKYGAESYGFRVFIHRDSIDNLSHLGDKVLAAFFPEEPGAFKRLATLLVLSKLEPLFHFGTLSSTSEQFVAIDDAIEAEWNPRICYLMVQPVINSLRVKKEHSEIMLSAWNDFPSVHSKEEFFLWLQWLRFYNHEQLDSEENLVLLGRMILGTSLILEAVYFQAGSKNELCGICDSSLDLTCAVYEATLWDNKLRDTDH